MPGLSRYWMLQDMKCLLPCDRRDTTAAGLYLLLPGRLSVLPGEAVGLCLSAPHLQKHTAHQAAAWADALVHEDDVLAPGGLSVLRGEEQGLAALSRLLGPGHQLIIVPARAARMSAGTARTCFCHPRLHTWSLQA